ncbi:unnamed protein product [Rotaria sp. Silwood1]|nr:unnamed protein product [Rotaria sp. Silwood1]CAF4924220.1 unnamed protein product [Rotaria sp. Silwood1]
MIDVHTACQMLVDYSLLYFEDIVHANRASFHDAYLKKLPQADSYREKQILPCAFNKRDGLYADEHGRPMVTKLNGLFKVIENDGSKSYESSVPYRVTMDSLSNIYLCH